MRLAVFVVLGLIAGCAPAASTSAEPEGLKLAFPVACEIGRTCEVQHYLDRDPGPDVRDYRCARRTYDGHNGIDIRVLDMPAQRAGVDVLAAAPGRVARLRDGVPDISIRAPGAPAVKGQECGNGVAIDHGDGWETQYCHLAQGSVGVAVGDMVAAGAPIGRVGLSGATEFPHLHFTVRREGRIVDPFAPDTSEPATCAAQAPMWNAAALQQMTYKAGAVLNAGFAAGPVTMGEVEEGGVTPPTADAPYLVAYVRAIELEAGDRVEMTIRGPDGGVVAETRMDPLDRDKAQYIAYVGRKRPAEGWRRGTYTAEYRVRRGGGVAVERTFSTRL